VVDPGVHSTLQLRTRTLAEEAVRPLMSWEPRQNVLFGHISFSKEMAPGNLPERDGIGAAPARQELLSMQGSSARGR
jgi:hypothetical protein